MAMRLSGRLASAIKRSATPSSRPVTTPPPLRAFCSSTTTHEGQAPPAAAAVWETASVEPNAGDAAPASAEATKDHAFDPFLNGPSGTGVAFGRMSGTGRYMLKSDVVHVLEGCNLTAENVKIDYNKAYNPIGALVQFPSLSSYETAAQQITKNGRLYRLEKVDRGQWDMLETYNGKVILLVDIPRNATLEDIERFLCGCNYDGSDIKLFNRFNETKGALVRFSSQAEAMHAVRVKNHGFCLNSTVQMRVLH